MKVSLRLGGSLPFALREGLPPRRGKVSRRGTGRSPFEARESFPSRRGKTSSKMSLYARLLLVHERASLETIPCTASRPSHVLPRDHLMYCLETISCTASRPSHVPRRDHPMYQGETIPCTKSKHIFSLILFDKIDWFGVEADSRSTVSHTLARLSDTPSPDCLTPPRSTV